MSDNKRDLLISLLGQKRSEFAELELALKRKQEQFDKLQSEIVQLERDAEQKREELNTLAPGADVTNSVGPKNSSVSNATKVPVLRRDKLRFKVLQAAKELSDIRSGVTQAALEEHLRTKGVIIPVRRDISKDIAGLRRLGLLDRKGQRPRTVYPINELGLAALAKAEKHHKKNKGGQDGS